MSGPQRTLDGWLSLSRPRPPTSTSPPSSPTATLPLRNRPSHQPTRPRDRPRHQEQQKEHQYQPYSKRQQMVDRGRVWSHQKRDLQATAMETRTALPDILKALPHVSAGRSECLYMDRVPVLRAADCPGLARVRVKIVNQDTLNAAIDLGLSVRSSSLTSAAAGMTGRVAVLNMASNLSPGGGWLKGAMAQEEALCYRSSLALSLHKRLYPWRMSQGLYSPDVVIIRSDVPSGHKLLVPGMKVEELPIVSALSIAALRRPKTKVVRDTMVNGQVEEREVYAEARSRELTKEKMRFALRMAASRGHRLLVLGALGCGAFKNPKEEVAACWLEVLKEVEFGGGWWEGIWFAVYDRRGEGNFEVFDDVLGGVEI